METIAPATRAEEPQPDFGPLPPLPSTPPPLPEGAVEGFDDLPEGATTARPLIVPDDVDLEAGPDGVVRDPVTGEQAKDLGTQVAGSSEELRLELENAALRKQLAELTGVQPAATGQEFYDQQGARTDGAELADMSAAAARPVLGQAGRAGMVDSRVHRDEQARYRALSADLRNSPVAVAEPEPEEAREAPLTVEEAAARHAELCRAEYERQVVAMSPDEPVYVVGPRASRLKVAGHTLRPGDVVPGAAHFPRLESWTGNGALVRRG